MFLVLFYQLRINNKFGFCGELAVKSDLIHLEMICSESKSISNMAS